MTSEESKPLRGRALPPLPLSVEQQETIKDLYAQGFAKRRIVAITGITIWRVEQVIDPDAIVLKRQKQREAEVKQRARESREREERRALPKAPRFRIEPVIKGNPVYSPERDGDLPPHQTLTAVLMGDPRPGRKELLARIV